MLGDEVANTFSELIQFRFIFGIIYVFIFVFISFTVFMNIFIVLMEVAFHSIRSKSKY